MASASELFSGVPAGFVGSYAGSTAPAGWLMCYGQAVSRTTYASLFAAIGTTYGSGDGSTTFNVPDARGRLDLGKDDMGGAAANRVTSSDSLGGVDAATLGETGGQAATQWRTSDSTDSSSGLRTLVNFDNVGFSASTDASQYVSNLGPVIVFNKIIKA